MLSNRERVLMAVLAILVGTAAAYVYTGRPSADQVAGLTAGTLDDNFGETPGRVTTDFDGVDNDVHGILVQDDGKFVVIGESDSLSTILPDSDDFAIARYNPDGSLDETFGDVDPNDATKRTGKTTTTFGESEDIPSALVIQVDGKIVVGGRTSDMFANPPAPDFALVRYNADGTLDETFGDGGRVVTSFGKPANIERLAIDSTGGIVAAGGIGDDFWIGDIALARYTADGAPDRSFLNLSVFTSRPGMLVNGVSTVIEEVRGLAIDEDDRIYVGGASYDENGDTGLDMFLACFTTNASLCADFGTDGKVVQDLSPDDAIHNLRIQEVNGVEKLLGVGISDGQFLLARFNLDGSYDTSFGMYEDDGLESQVGYVTSNFGENATAYDVGYLSDGRLMVVGGAYSGVNEDSGTLEYDVIVARYSADGDLDDYGDGMFGDDGSVRFEKILTFNGGGDLVELAVQADDKVLITGSAYVDQTLNDFAVIRMLGADLVTAVPTEEPTTESPLPVLSTLEPEPVITTTITPPTTGTTTPITSTSTSATPTTSVSSATSPVVSDSTSYSPSTTPTIVAGSPTATSTTTSTPVPTVTKSTSAAATTSSPAASTATTSAPTTSTTTSSKPVTTAGTTVTPSAGSTTSSSGTVSISPVTGTTTTSSGSTTTGASAPSTPRPTPTPTPTPTQTVASQVISLSYAIAGGKTYLPTEAIEVPEKVDGDTLELAGATSPAQPNTTITVYVLSTERMYTTTTDSQGKWSIEIPTDTLEVGDHHVDIETKTNSRHTVLNFKIAPVKTYATGALPPTTTETTDTRGSVLLILAIMLGALLVFLGVFRTLHSREMIHHKN